MRGKIVIILPYKLSQECLFPNLGSRDSEISQLGSSAAVQEYVLWLLGSIRGSEAYI